MVKLNRIYTRSGDGGETGLGDGTRVPKIHARIEAYGTVDELNACVGMCREQPGAEGADIRLRRIQNDLFDLGADLCVPFVEEQDGGSPRLRLPAEAAQRLETWIDDVNKPLPDLTSFVLPGGSPLAAALHLARTVCRRAERRLLSLCAEDPQVNPTGVVYLNRLSDLLFVMARAAAGDDEVLWQPGGGGEA